MSDRRSFQRRLIASLALLVAWTGLATFVAPALIRSGFHQQSIGPINAIFAAARELHPLEEFMRLWWWVAVAGLAWCALPLWFGPVLRRMSGRRFYERVIGPTPPGTLGAIRAFICGIMLWSTLWESVASTSLLPRSMLDPRGFLRGLHALPGFDEFLTSYPALWVFEHLTAVLLVLAMIGLLTRFTVPAAAFGYFVVAGLMREYSWFYHTGLIPLYVLIVLSFTRCGDGWSVDRLIRIARQRPVPSATDDHPRYGWAKFAVWVVIAVPYVMAGASKLYYGGFAWLDPVNMKGILLKTTVHPAHFDWGVSTHLVDAPDVLFGFLAVCGLFGELLVGFVLVSRWARWIMPAAMGGMHVSIWFLQNILFFDMILIQVVFYDWGVLRRAIGRRLAARRGRIDVLYDGRCGFCRRSVRVLSALDLFDRLRYVDQHQVDLTAYNREHDLTLTADDLDRQMWVVSRRGAVGGFDGYRRLACSLPVGWPFLPLMMLPGISHLGRGGYARLAANRMGIAGCDDACELSPDGARTDIASPLETPPPDDAAWRRGSRRGALVNLTVVFLLATWWFGHREFYPLTTMKMFAVPNEGKVVYATAEVTYEDGRTERAPFEEWIWAMAGSRYKYVIKKAFWIERKRRECEDLLDACAAVANRSDDPAKRIASFKILLWEWDYVNDVHSPTHGDLKDSFEHVPPDQN